MKNLLMVIALLMCSSCALFSGAKDMLDSTYEAGKARGRAEVMQDLTENKKKLDGLKEFVVMSLMETLSADDTDRTKLKELLPPLASMVVLLNQRGELLSELGVAPSVSVEPIMSDEVINDTP